QSVYLPGSVIMGSTNVDSAIGRRDWTNVSILSGIWGSVTVLSNTSLAANGTNSVALATNAIQCALPTRAGHRYELGYTLRGPGSAGWWTGEQEPLSQRARDRIGGNHGAFINGATNVFRGAGFVQVGDTSLFLPGMLDATNNRAGGIELGDPENL